ncbi:hypothetical protein [Micromonospora auratinigra]|uniref:Uncharacterized protein n=1 Tax=Micromonospora auratinigra TaxID=261654 RepID=A0A1A8ZAE8_9ACTN|nr:hypothetical protein [Micromonospora auratinigra]SBT40943.1 hypothetical protein GA0070611_1441 [Micromonospora auratinigra]
MPSFGDLFTDLRGEDRTMRVSYHADRGAVVLSLWSGTVCCGSFRLPVDEVDRLLALLGEVRATTTAAPDDAGVPPAAAEGPVVAPSPAVERTGDISGTTHRSALLPTPRVA